MTRRRQPRRGPGGRFLPRAQRDIARQRPAGQTRQEDAPLGVAPEQRAERPAGRQCEECGSELEYTWMHVGQHSYHVGRCTRCAPPPTIE